MKHYQQPAKKREPGFFGFIFESEAGFFIIIANLLAFGFFHYSFQGRELAGSLILYPANLFAGNYLCLITTGFIHYDWAHLGMNMLGVFVFARIVERYLGAGKTFFIYFGALGISMLFSTIVYTFILEENVAIIGASGALMGLIAAAMLLDPFCITYEMILPLPVMVKGWLFFYADLKGLLSSEPGGVSHLAHVFGFLSIVLLVYFLSSEDKRKMRTGLIINICSLGAVMVLRYYVAGG